MLSRDRRVVVVAMGRGGPAEPELIETPPTIDGSRRARASRSPCSVRPSREAALAGVPTVGCRRAGGGLAGAPFSDNVLAGARLAAALDPDIVIFDGSGAAIPPVAADARILVVNGEHDIRAGLNAYRVLVSGLVVDTGGADRKEIAAISTSPSLLPSCASRRWNRSPAAHRGVHDRPGADGRLDAEVVQSRATSRTVTRYGAELETVEAEDYLVELKAAAIDVVAETALARGATVVLAANEVVSPELDERLLRARSGEDTVLMTEPRRIMPLPLGGGELGLPYSQAA